MKHFGRLRVSRFICHPAAGISPRSSKTEVTAVTQWPPSQYLLNAVPSSRQQ